MLESMRYNKTNEIIDRHIFSEMGSLDLTPMQKKGVERTKAAAETMSTDQTPITAKLMDIKSIMRKLEKQRKPYILLFTPEQYADLLENLPPELQSYDTQAMKGPFPMPLCGIPVEVLPEPLLTQRRLHLQHVEKKIVGIIN